MDRNINYQVYPSYISIEDDNIKKIPEGTGDITLHRDINQGMKITINFEPENDVHHVVCGSIGHTFEIQKRYLTWSRQDSSTMEWVPCEKELDIKVCSECGEHPEQYISVPIGANSTNVAEVRLRIYPPIDYAKMEELYAAAMLDEAQLYKSPEEHRNDMFEGTSGKPLFGHRRGQGRVHTKAKGGNRASRRVHGAKKGH